MPKPVLPDDVAPGEIPVPRQRIGAYGVLLRADRAAPEILMTRISPWDYGAGMWTLPGGGIDHGEHPDDAVIREVHEETAMRVRIESVGAVANLHIYGRNRAGVLEDFQGIGIIYFVVPIPGVDLDALEILEAESSTDRVEWMPLTPTPDAEGRPRVFTNVATVGLRLAASRAGIVVPTGQ